MKTLETKIFGATSAQTSFNVDTTPDGSIKSFAGTITLTSRYIKPGTFVGTATISAAPVSITDNGSGVLTGTGVTGTLNYGTGAWTLVFTTAPDNTTDITGVYSYITANAITVTAADTTLRGSAALTYEGTLVNKNIIPNSASFSINFSSTPAVISDDANGLLTGSNVSYGYINYDSGYFKIVFSAAPDSAAVLYATYQHRNLQANEELVQFNWEEANVLVVKHGYSTAQYFHLSQSEDNVTYTYVGNYSVPAGGLKIVQISPKKFYRVYSSDCKLSIELERL